MMLLQQQEKIKESLKLRAYHEEKIKKALEKNDMELIKKREVKSKLIDFNNFFLSRI